MLAWTDAPGHGLGGTTPAWNNDLDLRVTAGGETFLGNALDAEGWSVAGGSADGKNNTEAVYLQPAQHGGSVTIEVFAADINSDALPNEGDDTDQDFALVCYNCKEVPAQVDLGVSATTSAYAEPGQRLQYAIEVTNAGPGSAEEGMTLAAEFPGTVSLSAAPSPDWTCESFDTTIVCGHPLALPAGGSTSFTLYAFVDAGASGRIDATFKVTTPSNDTNDANDVFSISTPVIDRIFADAFEAREP